MIPSLFLVWKSSFSSCVQALWSRHHLWGDGHVHKPAAGAAVRVGPPQTARKRRCFWRPGELLSDCSCCSHYEHGSWTSSVNRSFCVRVKMASKLCLQVEGCFPDTMSRCAELINNNTDVDFVDINSGCPIDLVYKKVNDLSQPSSPIQIKGKFHCDFQSYVFPLWLN